MKNIVGIKYERNTGIKNIVAMKEIVYENNRRLSINAIL